MSSYNGPTDSSASTTSDPSQSSASDPSQSSPSDPSQSTPSDPTPSTSSASGASAPDYNVTVSCMLFEGGALIRALGSNAQCQALADRVEQEDKAALAAGQIDFELTLDPIECGIVYESLVQADGDLAQGLAEKVREALLALLQENNIPYGDNGGQQGGNNDGSL